MRRISGFLRRLGVLSTRDAGRDRAGNEEVRLYLSLPPHGRLLVGKLTKDGDSYEFRYSDQFAETTDIPPLPGFPDRGKAYRSQDLWPFFISRLPPSDRPDVQAVIREQGIEPENALEMLGKLSKRAVSSPYELELAHH